MNGDEGEKDNMTFGNVSHNVLSFVTVYLFWYVTKEGCGPETHAATVRKKEKIVGRGRHFTFFFVVVVLLSRFVCPFFAASFLPFVSLHTPKQLAFFCCRQKKIISLSTIFKRYMDADHRTLMSSSLCTNTNG